MNLSLTMNDGCSIPQLGFGTCRIAPAATAAAVATALETGYRHIDTATIYKNEAGVGQAVAESGLPRTELFVTTKLWNTDQGYDTAIEAAERSLELLSLDYLDLYLIHWAQPGLGRYRASWEALVELRERGLVRSIGVSNFPEEQLREIVAETGVVPAIHQIELHPYFAQENLREVHAELGIVTQAWSPLGNRSDLLDNPVIGEIAKAHDATPAQVVLAWHRAHGIVAIPKSVTPERIVSNFESLNVALTGDEVSKIDALSSAEGRIGPDPADIDF